jgi:hypothetical protein
MRYLTEASLRLDQTMQTLDLSPDLSSQAVEEYERIARWLGAPDSPLAEYTLNLYPQGSFRLGTPIRPITHEDEFDIDLVCQLDIEKACTTHKDLKALVGDRLKDDPESEGRLEERRRCWTLFYPQKFHLDVLPTLPDAEHWDTGVLLTDTTLVHWQFSDPLGYARWFYERMQTVLTEERSALAKSMQVDIQQVPEWSVRTPLQRAVQVLKRHRDIFFRADLDDRPVSVILTTLAARAYENEPDLARALVQIIDGMDSHVEQRNGRWWVPNPAHDRENFADKWNEKPVLRDNFCRWRDQVYADLEALTNATSERDATLLLEKSLHGKQGRTSTTVAVPGLGVGDIPSIDTLAHREKPRWPEALQYECKATAAVTYPSGAGKSRFFLPSRLPKRTSIDFKATTNTPAPYQIHWQVTNTGQEARAAGQLRGEIRPGDGLYGEKRRETTSYNGTHIVQAFVVKDERIVAKSAELRVLIEKR